MTATDVHEKITIEASEKAVHEVRFIENIEIGRVVRQGDIYIHRVDDAHAHGSMRSGKSSRQLAVGETQGSRHISMSPSIVYEGTTPPKNCISSLLGPCVISDKRFTVLHPEHAYVSLPAGTYQVTHQMDARTLSRVQD